MAKARGLEGEETQCMHERVDATIPEAQPSGVLIVDDDRCLQRQSQRACEEDCNPPRNRRIALRELPIRAAIVARSPEPGCLQKSHALNQRRVGDTRHILSL